MPGDGASPDGFLGGRLQIEQPEWGFRSGTDAVLLAAAVPAGPGQSVLELGAGAGAASLCLMARMPGLALTGVEIDARLVAHAAENASRNSLTGARFVTGDVFALPPDLRRDFDHLLCNPPFHEGQASPEAARARALNDDKSFAQWLRIGLQRTVSGGFFTSILRADRLGEALEQTGPRGVAILPLWPRAGTAAKRVILQARKGSGAPLALLPGLVLHREDGRYTAEAEAILRDGGALAMDSARL